jgi:hypothetical protein
MKRICVLLMALTVLLSIAVSAQPAPQKNPVSSVIKEVLPRQEKNITAAVESMPADKFSYRPTPQQENFAHLVSHIIESNFLFCSTAADMAPPPKKGATENDSKEKLVASLKSSFEFCDTALAKTDDSKLGDMVEMFGGRQVPRAFAFIALASSWADHYGATAMYLRLNGILPPTAQKKTEEKKEEPKK